MPPDPSSVYDDDPTIGDDELLYRMVTRANTNYENDVAVRGATNAFQDISPDRLDQVGTPAVAVSVFLESELSASGLSSVDLVERWGKEYGVVSVTACDARQQDQGIVRWPTDDQPAHAMIFCLYGSKKTGGQSKRLAKASTVVIAPS